MKIVVKLQGVFERLNTDNDAIPQSSLSDLLNDLRVMATSQNRHHISSIHQSFGLNFLSQQTLEHLVQKIGGQSSFLSSTFLSPANQNLTQGQSSYGYRFSCPIISLQLSPHDPQLPLWSGEHCDGTYNLDISNDVDNLKLQSIRQESLSIIKQKTSVEIIRAALHSPDNFAIPVTLSTGEYVTIWQKLEELPSELQVAVMALVKNYFPSSLPTKAQSLIDEYKKKYTVFSYQNLPTFAISENEPKELEFIVGRGLHRKKIEALISSAQHFLLISSFRLEDESIIQLIAKKAKELPQGVWILTDLNNDVLDRVDTNMEGKIDHEDDYAESDRKKKECLRLLTTAGVSIRSGLFHLKCYITEKSSYMGSCNLTGGSLERNGEAGIIWKNVESHQRLIDHFCHLWDKQSNAAILPTPQGIRSQGLSNYFSISKSKREGFLTHHRKDLTETLIEFAHNPTGKISIYTRTFAPTAQQEELLSRLDCRIFYGHRNYSNLDAKQIYNLHAKIVIIGTVAAYIGSQDFAFGRHSNHDLTYETTDSNEIQAITQLIDALHRG